MNDSNIILLLKQGESGALKQVYVRYRPDFIAFGKTLSSSEDDSIDAYQDAIIVLQEKAYEGKLDALRCSLKTYLFSIGKYILFEKNRAKSNPVLNVLSDDAFSTIDIEYTSVQLNNNQLKLKKAFDKLGKKCREVLRLFYYRGFTIEEIKTHLNYDNNNVVKSQKSRCLKQLKEIIKDL